VKTPTSSLFFGLGSTSQGSPFEASMMVHFRKRFTAEMLFEINETLVAELRNPQATADNTEPSASGNLSDAQTTSFHKLRPTDSATVIILNLCMLMKFTGPKPISPGVKPETSVSVGQNQGAP
jgi:hypothetical protein